MPKNRKYKLEKQSIDLRQLIGNALVAIVAVIIGILVARLFEIGDRLTKIESQVQGLPFGEFQIRIEGLEKETDVIRKRSRAISAKLTNLSNDIDLLLFTKTKLDGPGSENDEVDFDGYSLSFNAKLQSENSYVELFFDLRSENFKGLERNQDGSYNLVGKTIAATVQAEKEFRGDKDDRNGVQLLFKNSQWESYEDPRVDVKRIMMSEAGMGIKMDIPNNEITQNVAGISLKFTLGAESNSVYDGKIYVQNMMIFEDSSDLQH